MELSTSSLRVLQAVAECGSFSAAASALGYTQSGISRQAAALEREVGTSLFERHRHGTGLSPAGLVLLRHARVALDELAAASREIADTPASHIRLGAFVSAGATVLPRLLVALRRRGDISVTTREGTTPSLVRAVRAGSLDLAIVTMRSPHPPSDHESPALVFEPLAVDALLVAAPAYGQFAGRSSVRLAELTGVDWIASPSAGSDPLLGVWPALPGRPHVAHLARDWLTKLTLVASGCGLTTVPPAMRESLPDGIILLRVSDGPIEERRMATVRLPSEPSPAVDTVLAELRELFA
jgi:DNA-binding transcriptional LysR family regulator